MQQEVDNVRQGYRYAAQHLGPCDSDTKRAIDVRMHVITDQQAYQKCLDTFAAWVNWEGPTDLVGLLLGLGDYYIEICILEEVLDIPADKGLG